MKAVHKSFNILLGLGERLGKKIVFVSERTPDRCRLYRWLPLQPLRQICFQLLTSFDMALEVWRARNIDAIFIFEHKPWYAYPLYAACLLKRKPVFFIVHGIQQTHRQSRMHRLGFKVLQALERRFNFWPVHLEVSDQSVDNVVRFSKSIVMRHPLPSDMGSSGRVRETGKPLRIGIVGILRSDKPLMPLLEALLNYHHPAAQTELLIGSPLWQVPRELRDLLAAKRLKIIDTDSQAQYNAFIHSLDIVVTYFDRDAFYFRPSGILNDAMAGGCFVVAPDYPVLRAQIFSPTRCGEVYSDISRIGEALDRAIEQVRHSEAMKERFQIWRAYRSDEAVIADVSEALTHVLASGEDEKGSACDSSIATDKRKAGPEKPALSKNK